MTRRQRVVSSVQGAMVVSGVWIAELVLDLAALSALAIGLAGDTRLPLALGAGYGATALAGLGFGVFLVRVLPSCMFLSS